jgi:hypothetical protein
MASVGRRRVLPYNDRRLNLQVADEFTLGMARARGGMTPDNGRNFEPN